MSSQKQPETPQGSLSEPATSAAEVLERSGRILFDNAEDWQSRLAANLGGIRPTSIREWMEVCRFGRIMVHSIAPRVDRQAPQRP